MVSMTLQLRYTASSSSLSTEIEETQMLERLGKPLAVVRPNGRGEVMWSSAGTRLNMNYANLRV